ncbi:hypothetical protein D918_01161 [Trichuris suis]|nr:hypothetical protein D918_01161 [Trichuris suis]
MACRFAGVPFPAERLLPTTAAAENYRSVYEAGPGKLHAGKTKFCFFLVGYFKCGFLLCQLDGFDGLKRISAKGFLRNLKEIEVRDKRGFCLLRSRCVHCGLLRKKLRFRLAGVTYKGGNLVSI